MSPPGANDYTGGDGQRQRGRLRLYIKRSTAAGANLFARRDVVEGVDGAGVRVWPLGEVSKARSEGASPGGGARLGGDAHALSEEGLVRRAQQYDANALARLYETYYPKLYAYAYMHLSDPHAAEDAAAAVLLQVLESLRSFHFRGAPFSAWVFRIARNHLIDLHRRRQRRPQLALREDIPSENAPLDDVVERSLDHERLRRALWKLGQDQRQVIVLKFMQGLDDAAAAQVMGRSQAAVKSLQHRALAALRRILSQGEGVMAP